MSASGFSDVTLAAKRALQAEPAVANGNVRRGQPRALQAGQAVAALVLPAVAQGDDEHTNGPRDWRTTVVVELQARAHAGQEPEDALDVLLCDAYARLTRLADFCPAVVEAMGTPRVEWDIAEADTAIATVRLAFTVLHRTLPGSLISDT